MIGKKIYGCICMGLFFVLGSYGQGMDREEWSSRFRETLREETKEVPAFVLQRLERALAGVEQEGWRQGLEPSRVALRAAALAQYFDEDLRRGASPVLAGLLYRQMSRNLSLGEEEGKENRNLSFEKLRDRVKDRNSGKEKVRMRAFGSKRTASSPAVPQGVPSGGSSGSGGSGGSGGAGESGGK